MLGADAVLLHRVVGVDEETRLDLAQRARRLLPVFGQLLDRGQQRRIGRAGHQLVQCIEPLEQLSELIWRQAPLPVAAQ
jgi:hypothetical protein